MANKSQNSKLFSQLEKCILTCEYEAGIDRKFKKRILEGKLTREENPTSHFAVFFLGYDPSTKRVFIGHHKKSDLWLPHGGHIEKGELLLETLGREIDEEWGSNISFSKKQKPELLTITEIENERQKCKRHYDIWYFIKLDEGNFNYDKEKIHKEFHCTRWCSIEEAKNLVIHPQTLQALNHLEEKWC